jgi:hypothetical protein
VEITPTEHEELRQAWEAAARASVERLEGRGLIRQEVAEQYLVLATCRDERQQVDLVERFQAGGLSSRAIKTANQGG